MLKQLLTGMAVALAASAGAITLSPEPRTVEFAAAEGLQPPKVPRVLSESDERDLALEALPAEMRDKAGVWILTDGGMQELRKTNNGYTCMVNRDEVLAIKPVCLDEEGTRTILPVNVYFANRMMDTVPVKRIRDEIKARFEAGTFKAPSRLGLAFMLSPRIVNVMDAEKGITGTAPPHYMVYAPNVTNAQLAIPRDMYNTHGWLPYIAYGGPHAFLFVPLPDSAVAALGHKHGS